MNAEPQTRSEWILRSVQLRMQARKIYYMDRKEAWRLNKLAREAMAEAERLSH